MGKPNDSADVIACSTYFRGSTTDRIVNLFGPRPPAIDPENLTPSQTPSQQH